MKSLITDYTFVAATGKITFTDETTINLGQILLIVNVVDGIIIYNFADPTKGGTVLGNVLTLNWNTTAMSDTDSLLIYYDVPEKDPLSENTFLMFKRLVKLLESNAVVDANNRQKVVVESFLGSGLGLPIYGPNSGQLYPSTNYPTANAPMPAPVAVYWQPVWIGPVDQRWQIIDAARMTYDNAIRSHLTFS